MISSPVQRSGTVPPGTGISQVPVDEHLGERQRRRRVRVEVAHRLLQRHRDTERGDQRGEPGGAAQRPVGEALHEHRDHHRDRRAPDEQERQREVPLLLDAGREQVGEHGQAAVGADHEDLTVREVDQLDDAVDHRVAQRDQADQRAEDEPVDDLRQERGQQKWVPSSSGRCGGRCGRRGSVGYRPGGGGRCPPPPECLRWFSRTVEVSPGTARRALDGGEVVALDRVDGEHLVRGVAELVEGDRAARARRCSSPARCVTTVWRVSSLHVPPLRRPWPAPR